MTDTYDPAGLAALGKRRKRALAELHAVRKSIVAQVIAAGRAGELQTRVVDMTGLTRNQVRLIWRGAGIGPAQNA